MFFFFIDGGVIAIIVFFVVLVPLFAGGLALNAILSWIVAHICGVMIGYNVLTFLIGLGCYWGKRIVELVIGVIANIVTFLPLLAVEVLYALPYIMARPKHPVDGIVEWLIVTVIMVIITCFAECLGLAMESSIVHLVIAVLYCVIVGFLLKRNITASDVEVLYQIYGFA